MLAKTYNMLPTADVFRSLRENGSTESAALHTSEISGSLADIVAAGNDLQAAAMSLSPDIAEVLNHMRDSKGVIKAQMSGSGSACFGLFDDADDAATAAESLAQSSIWSVATRF